MPSAERDRDGTDAIPGNKGNRVAGHRNIPARGEWNKGEGRRVFEAHEGFDRRERVVPFVGVIDRCERPLTRTAPDRRMPVGG